jgi:uncharacterized protein
MKTRTAGSVLAALVLSFATPVLADEASKNAKIEELMSLMKADQMMKQSFDMVKRMAVDQVAKAKMPAEGRQPAQDMVTKMMALMEDRMSWAKMKTLMVKVYADTFNEEEIDGIVGFYRSPAGAAFLQKMPTLMQKSMAISQEMMGDVMNEVQKLAEEEKKKSK